MKSKTKKDTQQDSGRQWRAATLEARAAKREDGEDGDVVVEMSVSSELPVETMCNVNGQYMRCMEILDHRGTSIDMSRTKHGLVVLDRHFGDQVGLIRKPEIRNGKLGGIVEFCAGTRAQEIKADALKGLRGNVSVGYVADPAAYRQEGEQNGMPVVRSTRWTPYEASFEPVPADPGVGVGRAERKPEDIENAASGESAPAAQQEQQQQAEQKQEVRTMSTVEVVKEAPAPAAKRGLSGAEVGEIMALGDLHRISREVVAEHLKNERSVEQFKEVCLAEAAKRTAAAPTGQVELPKKDAARYSLMRAIRCIMGKQAVDGIEREASDEVARINGRAATGLYVPHSVLARRDLTKSGSSSASVATNLMSGDFIELLRSTSILGPLGVRFMGGLVGDVAIPKLTGAATGYWVAENNAITESTPTLGQVTGSPHTSGVLVDISRRMILQSTPDAEVFVQEEIMQRLARTLQIAVFAGTGADGQPSAITAASGINTPSVTQGTPTYAQILDFPGSIMADNAAGANMKWAMTAEVWTKLSATFTNATYGEIPLINWANKTMLGFPYEVSEDVGANSLFFGDWSSVVVGVWGAGIDLNVDTATLSNTGAVRLVGLQDVDVMVRNGEKLAYSSTVTA